MKPYRVRKLNIDWKSDLNSIKSYIEKLEADNVRLSDRLIEYNKDEEIAKLHKEIDELKQNNLIYWTPEEHDRKDQVWKQHREQCDCRNVYYRVYPTGIGDVIYLSCDKCGFKKVISSDF